MKLYESLFQITEDNKVPDYENADNLSDVGADTRTVEVMGDGFYVETAFDRDKFGWVTVAREATEGGEYREAFEELARALPSQYRVVKDYSDGEYKIEEYVEE